MMRIFNRGIGLRVCLSLFVLISLVYSQTEEGAEGPKAPGQPGLNQQPAQEIEEVTDEELKKFAEVNREMQGGSQKMQLEMKEAIEEQGLKPNQYNQIAQKMEKTDGKAPSVSDENKKKAKKASESMKEIQRKHQQKQQQDVQKVLKEKGLSMNRYKQIGGALQKDKELQKKYMGIIQEQMKSKGGAPGAKKPGPKQKPEKPD